jgi:TRAP-type C4-dicarboxylate transport system permease large subunit
MILSYYLTLTQVTQELVAYVSMLAVPRWVILGLIVIMYVILGALLDELGMLLMTLPLTFPLMMELGYDPIWFGVIIVALCEVGMVCPPVGMTVFIVNAVTKIPLQEIYKGTLTLLVWEFIALALLILFPEIALFLPSRMGP